MKQTKYQVPEQDYQKLKGLLGREPNTLEQVLTLALWNEHCSYRSSRKHLKKFAFPTKKKISSLEEQAGIVDLGQGERVSFKMESHNHPSFIIPYHGAGTGVGGVLRDIFAMNARPIALADYLCFGEPLAKGNAHRVDGVVRGIGDYGNCIGIPTLTGHTEFSSSYNGNILVNAMALGYLDSQTKAMSAKAKGLGNYVVYVGSSTGRDGILGADMASRSFEDDSNSSKTTVQIGDPFFGKQLMEACLESFQKDLVVACQDMGAAGLTCSSFEMADKGNLGLSLHLDKIPLRDKSMGPEEILLSESQERMLLLCKPSHWPALKKLFESYQLEVCHVGEVLNQKEIELFWKGQRILKADPKLWTSHSPLENRAYEYPKPASRTSLGFSSENNSSYSSRQISLPSSKKTDSDSVEKLSSTLSENSSFQKISSGLPEKSSSKESSSLQEKTSSRKAFKIKKLLLDTLYSPNGLSRQFIYRQYDQRVGAKTLRDSSYPIAVARLPETGRELGIAMGCRPHVMSVDVEQGAKDAIFYPALQLALRGFKPWAVTDCLNFGNPEKKEIMGEFVLSVESLASACETLDTPIVSGNVSFYNESRGQNITPTPSIVMIGLKENKIKIPSSGFQKEGEKVYLLSSHQFYLDRLFLKDEKGEPNFFDFQLNKTFGKNLNQAKNSKEKNLNKSYNLKEKNEKKNRDSDCIEFAQKDFHKPFQVYGALQNPLVKVFSEQLEELNGKNLFSSACLVGKFGLAYTLSRMILEKGVGLVLDSSFSLPLFQERLYEAVVSVESEKENNFKQKLNQLGLECHFIGETQKSGDLFLPEEKISYQEMKSAYLKNWEGELSV